LLVVQELLDAAQKRAGPQLHKHRHRLGDGAGEQAHGEKHGHEAEYDIENRTVEHHSLPGKPAGPKSASIY
jgi:hypothetical protein